MGTRVLAAVALGGALALGSFLPARGNGAGFVGAIESSPSLIIVDYPISGSIFPPEITPPTFIWRDGAAGANRWHIDVEFRDGTQNIHLMSFGEQPRIGEIDPRCLSTTNELPQLTAEQASAHTWSPDPQLWAAIKKHSVVQAATVTISGFRAEDPGRTLSFGSTSIETSKDPVGAPIFYRDVQIGRAHV